MNDMTERLRLAAEYIPAHGWTKGTEQDEKGAVCLTGALRLCAPVEGDFYLIREVLRKRDRAEGWNDAEGRTESEVVEYLKTAEVTDADLADTFGPQWEQIVALVRRTAVLTAEEADRLYTARGSAWDAAWDAARGAAWDAARGAARDAEWDAAWGAARGAAWDAARDAEWDAARGAARGAAWDAAGALAIRPLIGQYGFTQEHYDILTGPWRKVIGPIHPDDAEMMIGDK